ncbi:MAG: hypothetical protein KA250_10450, partial [Verrucomicrobiales bacterium]|nr:hypothetical protein [Verrucomicrobiales bacterium]
SNISPLHSQYHSQYLSTRTGTIEGVLTRHVKVFEIFPTDSCLGILFKLLERSEIHDDNVKFLKISEGQFNQTFRKNEG